jgi:hypothetical protein
MGSTLAVDQRRRHVARARNPDATGLPNTLQGGARTMKVAQTGRVTQVDAVAHGTVFVGQVLDRPALCLKAFYQDADGRAVDRIVALSPTLEAYDGRPGILDASALTAPAVLEFAKVELVPDPDWRRTGFVESAGASGAGEVVYCAGKVYLTFLQGNSDLPDHVDLDSGEILGPPDKQFRTTVPSWSLVRRDGDRTSEVFRFEG